MRGQDEGVIEIGRVEFLIVYSIPEGCPVEGLRIGNQFDVLGQKLLEVLAAWDSCQEAVLDSRRNDHVLIDFVLDLPILLDRTRALLVGEKGEVGRFASRVADIDESIGFDVLEPLQGFSEEVVLADGNSSRLS